MFRAHGIACCLSLALSLEGAGLRLHAQPVADKAASIEKVLADWKTRLGRCKSVRYVVSGKIDKKDMPKGSKLSSVRPVKFVVLLDLVRGRVRIEYEGSGINTTGDRYSPTVTVLATDGKSEQMNIDRKRCNLGPKNADVYISKGSMHDRCIDHEFWPLLCAHGIVPTAPRPARVDRLLKQHTAEEFDSRGQVHLEGSPCLVLRTDPAASKPFLVDEFWIDPTKESAIVRHVYFAGTNPWLRFDTLYRKSSHGWMPASWTFAHTSSHLVEVTQYTVESVEIDPSVADADFILPIEPGWIVLVHTYPVAGQGLDPNRPAVGTFRVDATGGWLPLEAETGFTTGDGERLPPELPNRRWVWWGAAALGGIVALATGVVLYRRRMRRITTS